MNYALIENGTVTNVISLNPENEGDFPGAVPTDGRPVEAGDAYLGGVFTREGMPILSPLEEAAGMLEEAARTIAGLDAEVIELTYQNILLGLGV